MSACDDEMIELRVQFTQQYNVILSGYDESSNLSGKWSAASVST